MKRHLPDSVYNPITLCGAVLALGTLGLIGFLFLLELLGEQQHPYMGLITFCVLPVFLIFGLVLVGIGIIRESRRRAAGKVSRLHWPHIDLNDRRSRNALMVTAVGSFVFLMASAFGSYKAYEHTESVQFCGKVCHNVMKPEYTAYQASPHARVTCVQCHIGSGADWFVRSKLSGSYQVYSVLFNKYRRPIETPIANLRPARETCEQCHWPKHFYSAKMQGKSYYLSDEHNTPSKAGLLMRIGGGDPAHGATEGIHFHMYIANSISYVARDRQRLDIPYVESRAPDGKVTVYRTTDNPPTDDEVRRMKKHTVDCIDCHNRPTHVFRNPAQSVNGALAQNWMNPALPQVKRLCVEMLEKPYKTEAEALRQIAGGIEGFYQAQYPQVYAAQRKDVDDAVKQTQRIYSLNYFPEMRVSWKAFPDHIGHMYAPGCFRCHDGKHVSSTGKTLTNDCNTCHTILSQKSGNDKATVSLTGQPFRHPGNVGDAWKMMPCSDNACHGAQRP